MATMKMPCAVSGGADKTEYGVTTYQATSGTQIIPSTIKASAICCYIDNGTTGWGVIGAAFNSDGSQKSNYYGDTYNGGRFLPNEPTLTFVQNANNSISITHPSSSIVGGGTMTWVIIP